MPVPSTRRTFLRSAGLAGAGLWLAASSRVDVLARQAPSGWALADDILRRIVPPRFPARDVDIAAFGAMPGGTTDATGAIRDAIAACAAAGGGRVVVPPGVFLTGAIHLRSGVNLHLSDDATLKFRQDPAAYLPAVLTRFEGVELMNYSPFIYALDARDIAITGRGTLDGQGDDAHWWPWKATTGAASQNPDRTRLNDMSERGVPVAERQFGGGHFLRPNFIQPYRCANVLIEGVRIVNSPMWEVHPVLCTNVTVRNVLIESHGPNNDGCDPESCRDVLIEGCTFDTGDDCIALKSGRNADGRRVHVPIENVVIRDCVMKDGHGGVTVGSEISGGARNIFVERCRMDSPQLDRAIRFKNNAMRGGVIEHVFVRDLTVGEVKESIVNADFTYEEGAAGGFTPVLRDVEIRGVTSRKSQYAMYLRGLASAPIRDIRVVDCTFDGVAKPDVVEHALEVVFSNTRVNGQIRR